MKQYFRSASFWKKTFVWVTALLLSTLFIYAAYNKLAIYNTFVQQLKSSPATAGYENFLSWFVPAIEILIAALVLISKTRLIGLYAAFFLMLAFTLYVYIVPHFYEQHTCSCGGIINSFSWKGHFYFNLFFTLLAAAGLVMLSFLKQQKIKQA